MEEKLCSDDKPVNECRYSSNEITEWQIENLNFVLLKASGNALGEQANHPLFVNGEDVNSGEKLWDVLRSGETLVIGDLVVVMCSVIFLGTVLLTFCDIERSVAIAGLFTLLLICLLMWINAQGKKKRDALLIGVFVASFFVAQFTLYLKMYRGTSVNFTAVGLIFTQGIFCALSLKVWLSEPEKYEKLCPQSPSFSV